MSIVKSILNLRKPQKLAIVGLAAENGQFLKWLVKVAKFNGKGIIIIDEAENFKKLSPETQKLLMNCGVPHDQIFIGKDALQKLFEIPEIEWVVKTPGMWSLRPELQKFRELKGNSRIISSMAMFFEKFREKIIAVTGTKGKSTTSSLINHILNNFDNEIVCHYCGNTTNVSPYTFWSEARQNVFLDEYFVVETSSFQLQDLSYSRLSPKYSVITNYYVDHIDQHANKEEYWAAKDTVFKYQKKGDIVVLTQTVLDNRINKTTVQDVVMADENLVKETSELFTTKLLGEHNAINLSEALSIVEKVTENRFPIKENMELYQNILNSFEPLSHRIEVFKETKVDGVKIRFVDDGNCTEPNAAATAVKTLTEKENNFVWIHHCGKDKGAEMSVLIKEEITKSKQIYKINLASEIGQKFLKTASEDCNFDKIKNVIIHHKSFKENLENEYTNLEEIVKNFKTWIKENKIKEKTPTLNIVLSAAGSSFDEFKNYLERIAFWRGEVEKLTK